MAVTLEQIAERASVSITTVSKVINDRASDVGIKPETQKRILEIVKELNYHPNSSARSLRLRKSHTLGVVACDMREPYYVDILTGVEEQAKSNGYFCMEFGKMYRSIQGSVRVTELFPPIVCSKKSPLSFRLCLTVCMNVE